MQGQNYISNLIQKKGEEKFSLRNNQLLEVGQRVKDI